MKTNIQYILSIAILKKLWADNLITYYELKRIDEKNKVSFGVLAK